MLHEYINILFITYFQVKESVQANILPVVNLVKHIYMQKEILID